MEFEWNISQVASYLSDTYALSPPVNVRLLGRGANENYLIESSGHRYVFRIYCENDYYPRNSQTYQFELDLLAFLHERHMPVPQPVRRRDGQWLSTMDTPTSIRHSALFHFFDGEEHVAWCPEVNEHAVMSFGASVAEIHRLMDQFHSPFPRHHLDMQYLIDGPLRTLGRLLKERCGKNLEFFHDHADTMRRRLAELGKGQGVYGLIHADLHVGNILFNPDVGFCILDFDQCAFGWRAYDVATFKCNTIETVPAHLTDDIWRCFLAGYEQVCPLTQLELDS